MSSEVRNNASKPTDASWLDKYVGRLFAMMIRKGYQVNDRDLKTMMQGFRSKLTDSQVEEVGKLFTKRYLEVRKRARVLTNKLLNKVEGYNFTDSQVMSYVHKQCEKMDPSLRTAVYFEVSYRLQGLPTRPAYFRVAVPRKTKIMESLGFRGVEDFVSPKVNDKEEADLARRIRGVYEAHLGLHGHVVEQSVEYEDVDFMATSGKYYRDSDPFSYIHPVVAALFLPKIKVIDDVMLFSNLAGVAKCRLNNEPIQTGPDYELLINVVHDKNESVCDHESPLRDLLIRSEIQVALWKCVLALRTGRYYEKVGNELLSKLSACKYHHYDAPDLVSSNDEGDIVRRLMAVFSFRPIVVKTLPMYQPQQLNITTPVVNMDIYNGELDTLSIANIRLGLYNNRTPAPRIEHVLSSPELFLDRSNMTVVPKMTEIVSTSGVLVVYIHRREAVVPLTMYNSPFSFRDLPVTTKDFYRLNTGSVVVDREVLVAGEVYDTRSVVCVKTYNYTDSRNRTHTMLQNSETVIFPDPITQRFDMNTCVIYDPSGARKVLDEANDPVTREPVTYYRFNDFNAHGGRYDLDLSVQVATKGVVVVLTKRPGQEAPYVSRVASAP